MEGKVNRVTISKTIEHNTVYAAYLLSAEAVFATEENLRAIKNLKSTAIIKGVTGEYEEFVDIKDVREIIQRNPKQHCCA